MASLKIKKIRKKNKITKDLKAVIKNPKKSDPSKPNSSKLNKISAISLSQKAEILRLKRQVFILERQKFDSLKSKSEKMDHQIEASLLAAGVAHEFNNILGAADGHAEWALDSGAIEDMKEALLIVRQACHRSWVVTRALEGWAQPREESAEVFLISRLLQDVKKLFLPRMKKQKIDFVLSGETGVSVYGNYSRLFEVFVNLTKNSLDAIATSVDLNKGSVRNFIEIRIRKVKNKLEIIVVDSGQGVPAELGEKVFLPFFTTKGVLQEIQTDEVVLVGKGELKNLSDERMYMNKVSGSGLGLFLSRSIAFEHGGSLVLFEEKNRGTHFFKLTLPCFE